MKRIKWVPDFHQLDDEIFHFLSGRIGGIEVCWINISTLDSVDGDLYFHGEEGRDITDEPVNKLKNEAETQLTFALSMVSGIEING